MPGTTSPLKDSVVAALVVDVDGTKLTTTSSEGVPITRVTVTLEVDRPGSFVIESADLDSSDFEWIDGGSVSEGKPVTISMGWGNDLGVVMIGEITGIELDVSADSEPRVTIRGYDRLHRLTRGRRTRAFVDQKDSAIAETIAKEHGLTASVTATSEVHPYVLQSEETDIAFLSARARAIGYTIFVEDKILYFVPRPLDDSASLTIDQKSDLLSLSVRTSVLGQVGGVEVRGWNPDEQAALVSKAEASAAAKMGGSSVGGSVADERFGKVVGQVPGYPVITQAQADALAAAEVQTSALQHVTCEISIVGDKSVVVSDVVKIDGYGKRFSGSYYVDRVTHTFADDDYTTTLEGRRTAT
ncbi:MAG: phage late control D family protein [Myxococcales bacterium]|nr:phage late control D family protein [Myxococcales bacterium]MCB9702781.1 phage late control D family protein [Myxococcales bacterium]